jgi:chromosome segregation ATPase
VSDEFTQWTGRVAETASIVAEWKSTVAKIETEFNVATLARDNAQKVRSTHALAAAMQDANAVAEIKHARSADAAAAATLADLAVAIPAAREKLADAEKAAAAARHELAKYQAEKIMRERVAAAARMDKAFADLADAYIIYESLGRQLQSYPDLNSPHGGMAQYEGSVGFKRIAAAVPTFLLKLFPANWTNEAVRQPLAESEAHFWQLPSEKPSDKEAA